MLPRVDGPPVGIDAPPPLVSFSVSWLDVGSGSDVVVALALADEADTGRYSAVQ